MPAMFNDRAEAEFAYRTDPTTGHLVDAVVAMMGAETREERVLATDLLLNGTAMVTHDPTRGLIPLNPARWMITEAGNLQYMGVDGPRGLVLSPSEFLVLTPKEDHPPPALEGGTIANVDPWIEEWADIQERLRFMAEGR